MKMWQCLGPPMLRSAPLLKSTHQDELERGKGLGEDHHGIPKELQHSRVTVQ